MKRLDLDVKVRYYTRHNKSYQGDSPIMIRLYVQGERASLGQVGYSVRPCYLVNNKVVATAPKSEEINQALQDIECRIQLLAEQLSAKGTLSLFHLRDALSPSRPTDYTLVGVYRTLLDESAEQYRVGNITSATLRWHNYQMTLLQGYLGYQYGKDDLPLSAVQKDELSSYELYLKGEKNYTHNTAIKVLRFLRKAMERAVEEDLLMRVPFPKVVLRMQPTDRGFLDDSDLERLRSVELSNPKLLLVRDAFLFSCYTGLSYADISRLVRDNIISMHGQSWVVLRRKKTGVLSTIPLMSVAVHILTPYLAQATSTESSESRIFPLCTNPYVNQQLKEIQRLSGVKRVLTYHLARHTFATLALTKGVSLDTVGSVLGHSCLSTTRIYARVLPMKVSEEMRSLDNRLQEECVTN